VDIGWAKTKLKFPRKIEGMIGGPSSEATSAGKKKKISQAENAVLKVAREWKLGRDGPRAHHASKAETDRTPGAPGGLRGPRSIVEREKKITHHGGFPPSGNNNLSKTQNLGAKGSNP